MALRDYQRKRDFSKTGEPPPRKSPSRSPSNTLFVIQKHAASRLHYDFRLEMDGVLKSWAVPRGIPFEKGDKRLAVQVEDHPLDYARFEGIIPEGEYGGGTVMVWDLGRYEVSGGEPSHAQEEGKLHLQLHGEKLHGEWTLVRTRLGKGDKQEWLLMKTGDSVRPLSKRKDDQSALSGRTMKQIASAKDAEWHSNREPPDTPPKKTRAREPDRTPKAGRTAAKAKSKPPAFVPPMKPKLVAAPPPGDGWTFELKFDGYRAIAIKDGAEVRLLSRNEKPLRFPGLAEAVAALPCHSAVLDGEIVALDQNGRSSFQLLQDREMGEPAPICYYLFDLLYLDGEELLARPVSERKERLARLLDGAGDPVRFSADLPGEGAEVLSKIKESGLEGMLAKRAGSRYEPGLRSGAWLKIKCVNEQEFVIGGYTEPKGGRQHFGSLLVGYFEKGRLKFSGKVGAGFNEKSLAALFRRFEKMRVADCPFFDLPSRSAGRWNQGITPSQMKTCAWVKPELVCQIKFGEWTRDGRLRQPVFLGLREDLPAAEVVRERP